MPSGSRAPQRAVRVGRRAARRLTAPTSRAKGVGRCPRRAVDRQVGSAEPVRSKTFAFQKLRAKRTRRHSPFREGGWVSPGEAGAVLAEAGIALHTAVRSRPPARAGCRRRHARRHRHTRRQCAGRHPRRLISVPSAATLTRSFPSHAIIAAKRFPTTSVEFSLRDTRA